jgi:hypothetical protein
VARNGGPAQGFRHWRGDGDDRDGRHHDCGTRQAGGEATRLTPRVATAATGKGEAGHRAQVGGADGPSHVLLLKVRGGTPPAFR